MFSFFLIHSKLIQKGSSIGYGREVRTNAKILTWTKGKKNGIVAKKSQHNVITIFKKTIALIPLYVIWVQT